VSTAGIFHHTSYVVHDVIEAAERLMGTVGIGPWLVWTLAPRSATLRGRPVSYSFRVAMAAHAGSNVELVAPLAGESLASEHLTAHGEGFHHTCYMFDTRQAMRDEKARLVAAGLELLQEGDMGELGEFCSLRWPVTGNIQELAFFDGMPPPEKCIA